jgi:ketosteroid isomerase-like protein
MLPRCLPASIVFLAVSAAAQVPGTLPGISVPGQIPGQTPYKIISPITNPTVTPGQLKLLELEAKFSEAVAEGGGKAFASWFAEDAVVLNNGKPATLGRGAIAASATWSPKEYSLTWVAQGAQMGPSNDMGFTWGHYEGRSYVGTGLGIGDRNGQPVVTTGRYITVWKKLPDGTWKVAMDASADEPASADACCTVPKP